MLEEMLAYERDLFFLINGSHTEMMNYIMWIFSSTAIWAPLILVFLFAFIYKKRWTDWLPILLAVALVILLCDQFTSTICKPLFERYRPFTIIVFLWAAITGYSRIYLGVHFISDVVCGAIAGVIIGFAVYRLYMFATRKLFGSDKDKLKESFSSQKKYIAISIVSYISILTVFNEVAIRILRGN